MQTKKISDVSAEIGISGQTIRNYLKRFGEFFTTAAARKTRKQFTDFDIDQLRKIKDLLADGLQYDDIPAYLTPAPQVVDDITQDTAQPETAAPRTSAIEKQYQAMVQLQQMGHEREIQAKDETIAILQRQLDLARLPWWRRMFGQDSK
jgi:DNA-binding transcriptional MerR regulator